MSRVAHGDVRQRILDAAENRLWHYGFKKTTIDEIAADAGVGKGTVYLYFDNKEDVALSIMAQFKRDSLDELRKILAQKNISVLARLKEMLTYPATTVCRRCSESPSALEMVIAVRPHIQARLQPFFDQEIEIIATLLEEGNQAGVFAVEDTSRTARSLKIMCAGFWPPYPFVNGVEEIEREIERIVDLVYKGLRHCPNQLS
jgi:AcrR family transcriptional regulator